MMLNLNIEEVELFDEDSETFLYLPELHLIMEHSLESISKWESKFMKPWISQQEKTEDEWSYYFYCMCLTTDGFSWDVFKLLPSEYINQIHEYINTSMTATTVKTQRGSSNQFITSELIYYWMTIYNIPFSCDKWPINRLLTLITVCSEESQPKKKMSKKDILSQNRALSRARSAGR